MHGAIFALIIEKTSFWIGFQALYKCSKKDATVDVCQIQVRYTNPIPRFDF